MTVPLTVIWWGELKRQTVSLLHYWSNWPQGLLINKIYFRTRRLQCLRDVPQRLVFLTMIFDISHAWDGLVKINLLINGTVNFDFNEAVIVKHLSTLGTHTAVVLFTHNKDTCSFYIYARLSAVYAISTTIDLSQSWLTISSTIKHHWLMRYARVCICTEIVNGCGLTTVANGTFASLSTHSSAITPISTAA